jgi:hypothetical protein
MLLPERAGVMLGVSHFRLCQLTLAPLLLLVGGAMFFGVELSSRSAVLQIGYCALDCRTVCNNSRRIQTAAPNQEFLARKFHF